MNNIPTITFLPGLPVFGAFGKVETDYLIVFGENTKQEFIKNEIRDKEDMKKVLVLGCPRFDSLKSIEGEDKKIIVYSLEISQREHVMPENHLTKKKQKEILSWLFNIMKKIPDYHLILKTRPGWDMVGLPEKIAEENNFQNFTVIEKTDNLRLLDSANLVIINMTTMGLEALLLKKPVISVTYKSMDALNPYKKLKIVKKAYTKEQLENAVKAGLKKKSKFSMQEVNKEILVDGKATQRAVKLINKIFMGNK